MFTDKQLSTLMKLRLKNLGADVVTKIRVESRSSDGFTCIVSYKNWADGRQGMTFTRFYISEINYFLKIGLLQSVTEPAKGLTYLELK